jgi:acetolactate synthase-1/2/3 large subunit
MKTAAELVVQVLADAGVKHVFGISGDSVLALMDAIERTPGISYMTVRHEQVGTSMADGYARVTGDPGVVLAHMGPGVCNLVIGLASAFRDSSPVIALSGCREGRKIGRDSWHEIDQLALLRPITKWNSRITSADTAARLTRTAVALALGGRPGPVHLELPKDTAWLNQRLKRATPSFASPRDRRVGPNPALVAAPAICCYPPAPGDSCGRRCPAVERQRRAAGAGGDVAAADRHHNKGRSCIPKTIRCASARWDNTARRSPARKSSRRMPARARLPFFRRDHPGLSLISPGTKIIHVDIDPKELGRQFEEEISMVGDVKLFLQTAITDIRRREGFKPFNGPLAEHPRIGAIIEGREAEREAYFQPSNHAKVPGKPHLIVKEISQMLKRDAIVTVGAGLYARFAGRLKVFEPRSYLKSLGLGALGWAFPAALGAKLGKPSRQVITLMGDGDFLTVMQDLETAVRENIAVTTVIFNDFGHGLDSRAAAARLRRPRGRLGFERCSFRRLRASHGRAGHAHQQARRGAARARPDARQRQTRSVGDRHRSERRVRRKTRSPRLRESSASKR